MTIVSIIKVFCVTLINAHCCGAGTPLSERINKIFLAASDILKQEVRILLISMRKAPRKGNRHSNPIIQKLKNRDLEQRNHDLTSSIMALEETVCRMCFFVVLSPAVIM